MRTVTTFFDFTRAFSTVVGPLKLLAYNNQQPEVCTTDLYASSLAETVGAIQTYYEQMFLREGKKVLYLRFALKTDHEYAEIPETE